MPIEISSLKQLSPEKVQAMVDTLSQLMAERHPEVELTRGVFHDLVLYFDSLLNAAIQENIDRLRQSNSLLKITENPDLADPDIVDQVLSNFNVTRDNGSPAVGYVTVIFNSDVQTEILTTAIFGITDGDITFTPTQNFVVLPTDPTRTITEPNQRKMVAVGDGTYAATITVVAREIGAAGNIRRRTRLTTRGSISNVVDLYASADFIEGRDPASNTDYLARLSAGLSAKTIGSRQSYAATIKTQTTFANTLHLSILGCGDAEQQRDQHSLFPVSGGGKVDIYAHTNAYAQEREHLLDATYVGPYGPQQASAGPCDEQLVGGTPTGTIWQVTIGRDLAPGFYEVIRITDPSIASSPAYSVLTDTRNVDFSDFEFVPDVLYLAEGAYTRYQTATIRFVNPDIQPNPTLIPNQTKRLYDVITTGLPLIAELQDYLAARETRARATDVLVKAPVPCFTKISFEIRKSAADSMPDIDAIKRAVSKAVAGVGFTGQLHASLISNAAHQYLSKQQALGSVDMFGRIRRPDGSVTYVRDNTILQVPNDAARLVTGRTTAFLTSPEDVSVSVVSAGWTN
jgi:hypothetical protein